MALAKIFVVVDPQDSDRATFQRATQSAVITGASLHLFLCATDELLGQDFATPDAGMAVFDGMLSTMVKDASAQGVQCSSELIRAENWSDEALRSAASNGCDMIFKSSFYHSQADRALKSTSDWNLMRHAPCPVLMVKNFHDWRTRKVLAAIKCDTADASHIKLDRSIINMAQRMAEAHGSEAHFVCSYRDKRDAPELDDLESQCGVNRERIHRVSGDPADAILGQAAELKADLVIVGTVARTGMVGRVVGNTSEKILDQTESDVLVIN